MYIFFFILFSCQPVTVSFRICNNLVHFTQSHAFCRPCGSAVGWGTALYVRKLWVRFHVRSFEIFHWPNRFGCTMALGSTQLLREISTRDIPGGKVVGAQDWQPCHFHVPVVKNRGSLIILTPLEPIEVCMGMALPCTCFLPVYKPRT